MGLMDKAAIAGIESAAKQLKPFLESIHARLELINKQLEEVKARLDDKLKDDERNRIDSRAKQSLEKAEAEFK